MAEQNFDQSTDETAENTLFEIGNTDEVHAGFEASAPRGTGPGGEPHGGDRGDGATGSNRGVSLDDGGLGSQSPASASDVRGAGSSSTGADRGDALSVEGLATGDDETSFDGLNRGPGTSTGSTLIDAAEQLPDAASAAGSFRGATDSSQSGRQGPTVASLKGERVDYNPDTEVLVPSGKKGRAEANLAAIELIKTLDEQGRYATAAEQAVLAGYSSWGAVPEIFEAHRQDWAPLRERLQTLLTAEEYDQARETVLNAHYTDPAIASAMWQVLTSAGFSEGYVLEPGCGTGNFMGQSPASANMVGVELDSVTARIASYLYPSSTVRLESFGDTRIPVGGLSAAIGNVPFGNYKVADALDNPHKLSIHNHFIHKSMKNMAPGGYGVFLTSSFTMDARTSMAREVIGSHSDLVGAVRLPAKAFSRVAGTDVVTDILVFRRREPKAIADRAALDRWIPVIEVSGRIDDEDVKVFSSSFFEKNPQYVLGEQMMDTNQFGQPALTVRSSESMPDLAQKITTALSEQVRNAGSAYQFAPSIDLNVSMSDFAPGALTVTRAGDAALPGTVRVSGKDVQVYSSNYSWEPKRVGPGLITETRALIDLKETVASVVAAGAGHHEELEEKIRTLSSKYDAYVQSYGPINRFELEAGRTPTPSQIDKRVSALVAAWRKNYPAAELEGPRSELEPDAQMLEDFIAEASEPAESRKVQKHLAALRSDPDFGKLLALEVFDEDTHLARKSGYFTAETFTVSVVATSADNAADALSISMDETGGVDLGRIAQLRSVSEDEARAELGEMVFDNPVTGELEHRVKYLSGEVRVKLDKAREAALLDPVYEVNVTALEQVVPQWASIEKIAAQPGAQFITAAQHQRFIEDVFQVTVQVQLSELESKWDLSTTSRANISPRVLNEFGTSSRNPLQILEAVMNNRPITVRQEVDGKKFIDQGATMLARSKASYLKDRFTRWIREDNERIEAVEHQFNYMLNSDIRPDYTTVAAGLKLPRLNPEIEPRYYQREAVARIRHSEAVLLDHTVGAGKTGTMIMSAMELRRTGAARKPWIVVPNPLVEQITREALQWYPNASVLMIPTGLGANERREYMARAAAGDWDMVVCPQSVFTQISVSPERQMQYLREQKDSLEEQKREAKGDRLREKDLQKALKSLEARIKYITDRKKDGTSFEETGCDYLFVDEAHHYKNLQRISEYRELSCAGSMRSTDLDMILRTLRDMKKDRAFADGSLPPVATLATGTPVSNALAEMWVMGHYVNPVAMEKFGVASISGFGSTFTVASDAIEVEPTGTSFRAVNKINRFRNMEQLMGLYFTYASVVTRDQIPAKLPEVVGGKMVPLSREASFEVEEYIKTLVSEVQNPGPNDYLVEQLGRARKVALDPRLVGLERDADGGRAGQVADSVMDIEAQFADTVYRQANGEPSERTGGLQLLFCDYSTPKYDGTFNMYDAIKEELIARGMDADRIAFIHDANNDVERAQLFARARNGELSVLIGSTNKMGTGVNIQDRVSAIHHVDVPWKPADLEQREGRGIRSGNQNDTIHIRGYVTEKSFDAYMWQLMLNKAQFLAQLKTGSVDNEVSDIGLEISASEFIAAASGDPRVVEFMDLQTKVMSLQLQAVNEANARANTEFDLASLTARRDGVAGSVQSLRSVQQYVPHPDSKLQIGNRTYSQNTETTQGALLSAVTAAIPGVLGNPDAVFAVGRLGSLPLIIRRDPLAFSSQGLALGFAHPVTGALLPGRVPFSADDLRIGAVSGRGLVQRLYNAGYRLGDDLARFEKDLEKLEIQQKDLEAFASSSAGFSGQAELDELSVKLEALAAELQLETVATPGQKTENELLDSDEYDALYPNAIDSYSDLREGDLIEIPTLTGSIEKGVYRLSRTDPKTGETIEASYQWNLVGDSAWNEGQGVSSGEVHGFFYSTKFNHLNRQRSSLNGMEKAQLSLSEHDERYRNFHFAARDAQVGQKVIAPVGDYPDISGVVEGTLARVGPSELVVRDGQGTEHTVSRAMVDEFGLITKEVYSTAEVTARLERREAQILEQREALKHDRVYPGDTLIQDAPNYGKAGWVALPRPGSYRGIEFMNPETGERLGNHQYGSGGKAVMDMVRSGRDITAEEFDRLFQGALTNVEIAELRAGDVVEGAELAPKKSLPGPVRIVSIGGSTMRDIKYRRVDEPVWEPASEVRRKESVVLSEVSGRRYGALSRMEKAQLVTDVEAGVSSVKGLSKAHAGSWVILSAGNGAVLSGRLVDVRHNSYANSALVDVRTEDDIITGNYSYFGTDVVVLAGDYPETGIDFGSGLVLEAAAPETEVSVVAAGFGFKSIPGFAVRDIEFLVADTARRAVPVSTESAPALEVESDAVQAVADAPEPELELELTAESVEVGAVERPLADTSVEQETVEAASDNSERLGEPAVMYVNGVPIFNGRMMEVSSVIDKGSEVTVPLEGTEVEPENELAISDDEPQVVWCVNRKGLSVQESFPAGEHVPGIYDDVKVPVAAFVPAQGLEDSDTEFVLGSVIANAPGEFSVLVYETQEQGGRVYRVDVDDEHLEQCEFLSREQNRQLKDSDFVNDAALVQQWASSEVTNIRSGDRISVNQAQKLGVLGQVHSIEQMLVVTCYERNQDVEVNVIDPKTAEIIEYSVGLDAHVTLLEKSSESTRQELRELMNGADTLKSREVKEVEPTEVEPQTPVKVEGKHAVTEEPIEAAGLVGERVSATEDAAEHLVIVTEYGEQIPVEVEDAKVLAEVDTEVSLEQFVEGEASAEQMMAAELDAEYDAYANEEYPDGEYLNETYDVANDIEVMEGAPWGLKASQVRVGDKVTGNGIEHLSVYAVNPAANRCVAVTVLAHDGLKTTTVSEDTSVSVQRPAVAAAVFGESWERKPINSLRDGDVVLYEGKPYRVQDVVHERGTTALVRAPFGFEAETVVEPQLSSAWMVQMRAPLVVEDAAGVQGGIQSRPASVVNVGDVVQTKHGVPAVIVGWDATDTGQVRLGYQMMLAGHDDVREFVVSSDYPMPVFDAHERTLLPEIADVAGQPQVQVNIRHTQVRGSTGLNTGPHL